MMEVQSSPKTQGEVVLVVEDDPRVQAIIELLLVSSGYRVVTANDGIDGLKVFREHLTTISVVITDLKMPRLNGVGLVHAIRTEAPNIPIVVASGYLDETSVAELKGLDVCAFLNKPVAVAQLLKTLTEAAGHGEHTA